MMVAGTIAATAIDQMQGALEQKSGSPVRKTVDSASVAKLETAFTIEGKVAPVAVTVYKNSGRARIQILTHELSQAAVKNLQDEIALALGARIVDRTDMSGSSLTREAPPDVAPNQLAEERQAPPSKRDPRAR
jgi:hypothetical protein